MSNILILGSGTQGLAIAKDLTQGGHKVFLYSEKHNYADSSRWICWKKECLSNPLSFSYLKEVLNIIERHQIHAIIPMGDALAEFLSKNKEVLCECTRIVMPEYEDFKKGCDKNSLMKICKEKGYPHPLTINTVENLSTIDKESLLFPLLIKPNITCGARGMTLVNSYEELMNKYPAIRAEYGDCHLQKYVKQGGAQVEVQLYIDENKKLVNSSVIYKYRWYPEKGGSSCCAVSIRNEKIVGILHQLLIDLNWVGFADFDTIEDPDTGELLIMELNPRVPACVKCPIEAGIHWGQIIADTYLGNEQKIYSYKEGEYLRHLGFDTLWFLKSKNRFKTRPNWFKLLGKHIHYQDMSGWSDPMPFLTGTLNNLRKIIFHRGKEKIVR